MVLIVNGVCRYAINGVLEDRPMVTMMDIQIDTTGSTMSREDAIFDQAGVLINQWNADIMPDLVDDYTFNSVSWVDLDEADGSTGTRSSTGTTVLPQFGDQTAHPLPGNAAALITKQIQGNRARRNGRLYLSGISEGATGEGNGNLLTPLALAALESDFSDFHDNVDQEDTLGTSYSSNICVVHITERDVDGNPTAGVFSPIEGFIVQSRLASQRRRLRG